MSVKGHSLTRLTTLSTLIYSLIKNGKSRLTELSTGVLPELDHASRVKKFKRWLKNEYVDSQHFFIPFLSPILESLAARKEVVLAIDGSPVGCGCVCLMVSLIWKSRSIPLCWLVRKGKKGHFPVVMHLQVVQQLAQLLPTDSNIILLGDGEFSKVELMQFCEEKGWSYVFRTAKNRQIVLENRADIATLENALYPSKGNNTAWYPNVYFTRKQYGLVAVVCHHDPKHQDPWYLVSNLDHPSLIIRLYNKRFAIETLFGDLKSRGFNIHKSQLRCPERLSRLLIAVCLAFIFTILAHLQSKNLPPNFMKKVCRQDQLKHFSLFFRGKLLLQFIFDFPDLISNYCKELLTNLICVRFEINK